MLLFCDYPSVVAGAGPNSDRAAWPPYNLPFGQATSTAPQPLCLCPVVLDFELQSRYLPARQSRAVYFSAADWPA